MKEVYNSRDAQLDCRAQMAGNWRVWQHRRCNEGDFSTLISDLNLDEDGAL